MRPRSIANLSQFKELLRQPGVTLTLTRNDINPNHPAMGQPRRISKVGATHFTFEDGMEAGFRSAQAWSFFPIGTATLTLNSATTHGTPALVQYSIGQPPCPSPHRK